MASKRFREAVGIDPDRIVSAAIDAALGETQPRKKKRHPGRVLAAGAAVAAAAAVGQRRLPRLAKVPLRMGLHKLGDMAHVDDIADAVRDRADAVRDRLTGDDREPEDEYYDDDEEFDEEELDDEPRDEADEPPDDEDFDDEDDEGFDDEPPEDDDGPRGEGDEIDEEELDDEDLDDEPEDAVEDEPEDDVEDEPEDDVEDDEPEEDESEEDVEDDEPPEDDDSEPEEDDEQIAARSLDLGVEREDNGTRDGDRVPDLFEALRTPHRRAPVMRRRSHRVDPATRPPEPDKKRDGNERRDRRPKQSKSKAARA